jgi:redox-sensitive bicupin YhaK (pirin superfamily)
VNPLNMSQPLSGAPLAIGDHFFAHSFHRKNIGHQMNPLLMVDHFWMKRDTFGWHPHSAISAVTYVFEDSKSAHHNYDSMGNHLPIRPGSLHWMVAGSGATHRERPEDPDALVHAMQIFVELPDSLKTVSPYAIHLESEDIPEVMVGRARVRVVAGEYRGVKSPAALPQPFSFYDIGLPAGASLEVPLESGWGGWFYAVAGEAIVDTEGQTSNLAEHRAVGMRTSGDAVVTLKSRQGAHVVVLGGEIVGQR